MVVSHARRNVLNVLAPCRNRRQSASGICLTPRQDAHSATVRSAFRTRQSFFEIKVYVDITVSGDSCIIGHNVLMTASGRAMAYEHVTAISKLGQPGYWLDGLRRICWNSQTFDLGFQAVSGMS
jgi:hypothetical protein